MTGTECCWYPLYIHIQKLFIFRVWSPCETRHLASHNISTIVHGTSKFRYTWRESWCNCARNALHADRGRVISLPRERESLDTFGVRIWQWIYVALIWHPGFDNNIVTTNAQNNYILFEFFPSITKESWTDMHTESTKAPTCWQQARLARLGLRRRRSVLLNTFLTLRILFTIYPFAFYSATVVVF